MIDLRLDLVISIQNYSSDQIIQFIYYPGDLQVKLTNLIIQSEMYAKKAPPEEKRS